ncbi:MAG: hypothetical protein ACI4LN_07025 [Anaerovoracaceae bacterium]
MRCAFRKASAVMFPLCLLLMMMTLMLFSDAAYAAGEVGAKLEGGGEVPAEETFSVVLTYEGENLREIISEISYDADLLEFRSCSGGEAFEKEKGILQIQMTAEEEDESPAVFTAKLRFCGLTQGEGFVTAAASRITADDGSELTAQTRSVKIIVTEKVEEQPKTSVSDVDNESGQNTDLIQEFLHGLSVTEFEIYCLCLTVILLLLILLVGERRNR